MFTVERGENFTTFGIEGALAAPNTDSFRDELLGSVSKGEDVFIDFQNADRMDVVGLGVLREALARSRAAHTGLIVDVTGKPRIERLFVVTGLNSIFNLVTEHPAVLEVQSPAAEEFQAGPGVVNASNLGINPAERQ
jgi:anti-anti-sigma factor